MLQRLVRLGLLVPRRDGFVPLHKGKFRWSDQSKLATVLNREWSQVTLKQALRAKSDNTHRWMAGKLSLESLQKIKVKLLAVLEEAALQSERDENTMAPTLLRNFTALVAVANGGVFDHLDPHPSQIET